jgi:hypothetical protein
MPAGRETEGGNRVMLFDPAARDRAEEERIAQWVDRIRNAIAGDDGFVLNYQPDHQPAWRWQRGVSGLAADEGPDRRRGEAGDVLSDCGRV